MYLVSEEEADATMDLVSEMEVTCECLSGGGGRSRHALGFDRQWSKASGTGF
jgi:hypothetical protein